MYCPNCGMDNQDKVRFCRRCGANLSAFLEAIQRPTNLIGPQGEEAREYAVKILLRKIEETKTTATTFWGLPVLPELVKQLKELTVTPEERRQKYIRHGMVTTGVGIGVSLFLYLFFHALTSSGVVPDKVAPILEMIWANGLVPLSIGLMMLLYGLLFARGPRRRREQPTPVQTEPEPPPRMEVHHVPFSSVTEQTTTHLESPEEELPPRPLGSRTTG